MLVPLQFVGHVPMHENQIFIDSIETASRK